MSQTGDHRQADEQAVLGLLPPDGNPADSKEIRSRLGWDVERYASACVRLEEQGYVLSGQGRGESACRDLDGSCRRSSAQPAGNSPACSKTWNRPPGRGRHGGRAPGSGSPRKAARRCRVTWPGWPSWRRRSPPAPGMRSRPGPSPVTATSRAAYCRLCWAAPELVLTCTASRTPGRRTGSRAFRGSRGPGIGSPNVNLPLFDFGGAALPSIGIFQNPAGVASATQRAACPARSEVSSRPLASRRDHGRSGR